jgi:hypothetical protein
VSRNQWIILGALGLAVVLVFGCLGNLALTYLARQPPTETPQAVQGPDTPEPSTYPAPNHSPTPHLAPTATMVGATHTPGPPLYELALVSMLGSESDGYLMVEGQVTNISGSPLDNVLAILTVYDANDGIITSDEAPIDHTSILPGQTSPFGVSVPYDPAMEWFDIEFEHPSGDKIPTRDDRS